MAQYNPPDPLNFSFERIYVVPAGDSITFRLYNSWESDWSIPWKFVIGEGDSHEFVPDTSRIIITLSEGIFESVYNFIPDSSGIIVSLSEGLFSETNELHADRSTIKIGSKQGELEFLLELHPDKSSVNVTLSEGLLEDAAGFHADRSTIKIRTKQAELELYIDFVPVDSKVKIDAHRGEFTVLPNMVPSSSCIKVDLSAVLMRGTEPQHLPSAIGTGKNPIIWRTSPKRIDQHHVSSWNRGKLIDAKIVTPYSDGTVIDRSNHVVWRVQVPIDSTIHTSHSVFDTRDRCFNYPYISTMLKADSSINTTYDALIELNASLSIAYKEPGAMDRYMHTSYLSEAQALDRTSSIPYKEPGASDRHFHIPYGPAGTKDECSRDYQPPAGNELLFDFNIPISQVDDGDDINVYFEALNNPFICLPRYHRKTGNRDTFSGPIEMPSVYYPIPKLVYYMYNTVLVKELTTNHPIEVLAVSITTDRSSWLYQFNVTIASKDCLQLLKPSNGVFATIVINLNGWEFYCTVEGWSENRRFGGDSWTITGRSHSLMFGSPVSPKINWTEPVGMQGEQLVNNIVTGKSLPDAWPPQLGSWSVNWDDYYTTGKVQTGFTPNTQWYIPGGTVQYPDNNEIEVIKDIVGGIGAFIQTEPSSNQFTVKPIYAHMPWNWTLDNASISYKALIDDQFIEVSRNFVQNPYYQGVHVIGESLGGNNDGSAGTPGGAVFTDVRYISCGSSTAKYAPMITNKYVTSTKVALELGRMTIGASGDWVHHTIRLATLCPPGTPNMGLFKVGDMIAVMESSLTWQGQITGLTVNASNTSGGAFAIEQVLNVEEYVGGLPSC